MHFFCKIKTAVIANVNRIPVRATSMPAQIPARFLLLSFQIPRFDDQSACISSNCNILLFSISFLQFINCLLSFIWPAILYGIKMKYCELISVTNLIYHLLRLSRCMSAETSRRILMRLESWLHFLCLTFCI